MLNKNKMNLLENQNSSQKEKVFNDKKLPNDLVNTNAMNLQEISSKVLKRVSDLLNKTFDAESADDLTKRLSDVKVNKTFCLLSFSLQYNGNLL